MKLCTAKTLALLTGLMLLSCSVRIAAAEESYNQDTVLDDAADFFGEGTEGLGEVVEKIFAEFGRPNG